MSFDLYKNSFFSALTGSSVFRKNFQVFLFLLLLLFSASEGLAQTYLKDKGIIWELNKPAEPRLKFRFGTTGINIGGYEGTTLVIENITEKELVVDTRLMLIDFCNGTKTYTIKAVIKPKSKIGGNTWMGGSEQNDYQTTCPERKEYDTHYKTKISAVALEIVSVRESGSKPADAGSGSSGTAGTPAGSSNTSAGPAGGVNPNAGNNNSGTSNKPCPTYGFKFSNKPGSNCVALDWWSLSTKVNMMDGNGNFSQSGGPDAVRFTIQFRKQGDLNWSSETRNNTGKNTHLLTGLDACTKYEVRLITTCENNAESEPTNAIRFITACNAPAGLAISNIRDFSAEVGSGLETGNTYPCDPATNKIRLVEYKAGGANWEEVNCNLGSPCVLNALVPGTIYRVRARYKYGNNLYSDYTNEVSFTTTGTKPDPCGGTSAANNQGAGSSTNNNQATGTLAMPTLTGPADGKKIYGYYVELAWNSVPGASSYEILVATQADFSDAVTFKTTSNSYPPSNYGKAKVYYWKVRAKGPNGKVSYWSQPASFLVD